MNNDTLIDLRNRIILLGEEVLNMLDPQKEDASYIFALVTLLKTTHQMRSVNLLCANGLAVDAICVLRPMFEILVDFKFITKNPSRLQDMVDYDDYLRLAQGKKLLKHNLAQDVQRIESRNKELEDRFNKNKERFSHKNKRIFKRWSGSDGLLKLAKEVGLENTYDFLWGYFSNFMHSTMQNDHYYLNNENGIISTNSGASLRYVKEVSRTALSIYIDVISAVNISCGLDMDKKITSLAEEIQTK